MPKPKCQFNVKFLNAKLFSFVVWILDLNCHLTFEL